MNERAQGAPLLGASRPMLVEDADEDAQKEQDRERGSKPS
jgi:hypothetical protein